MTYGGDEEIVLKGGAKKALKLEKTVKLSKKMFMHSVRQVLFAKYRLLQAEWEYAAAADAGQREYNIYKGQKKYRSGSYTRSGKNKVREIN
jgi:hypothetical protein